MRSPFSPAFGPRSAPCPSQKTSNIKVVVISRHWSREIGSGLPRLQHHKKIRIVIFEVLAAEKPEHVLVREITNNDGDAGEADAASCLGAMGAEGERITTILQTSHTYGAIRTLADPSLWGTGRTRAPGSQYWGVAPHRGVEEPSGIWPGDIPASRSCMPLGDTECQTTSGTGPVATLKTVPPVQWNDARFGPRREA